ncbi:hypothetical protein DPMN_100989 [Dreissena polymorpha]|uniref:Uncharacterized protein n=1 Tax=Dreissena polymorpha TaxID=45954 RepID=A0A9D4LI30_DREPO|nr:hypothetical protein DPMN_100989 [Dreissena polymorpha]
MQKWVFSIQACAIAQSGTDFPSRDDPQIHSPNIDALARKSLLLKKAYSEPHVLPDVTATGFDACLRPGNVLAQGERELHDYTALLQKSRQDNRRYWKNIPPYK